jgi:hypothetical protein
MIIDAPSIWYKTKNGGFVTTSFYGEHEAFQKLIDTIKENSTLIGFITTNDILPTDESQTILKIECK